MEKCWTTLVYEMGKFIESYVVLFCESEGYWNLRSKETSRREARKNKKLIKKECQSIKDMWRMQKDTLGM